MKSHVRLNDADRFALEVLRRKHDQAERTGAHPLKHFVSRDYLYALDVTEEIIARLCKAGLVDHYRLPALKAHGARPGPTCSTDFTESSHFLLTPKGVPGTLCLLNPGERHQLRS